ncbi:hypothetical protein BH11BAC4_BH11BAC4_00400 [soil metagenome]
MQTLPAAGEKMKILKIQGKALRALGYSEKPVISIAIKQIEKNYKNHNEENAMNLLKKVLEAPVKYMNDAVLGLIAAQLLSKPPAEGAEIALNQHGIQFNVSGAEHIEQGAMNQMYQAAKLPVAVAGALMPDAHHGYSLPISGVPADENAVIPYGAGVDIGCRMCLSVFDIDPAELLQKENYFTRDLNETTLFGGGRQFDKTIAHDVIERKEFNEIPILKHLQGRAARQLGTSGSGNHFVEFGIVDTRQPIWLR